MVINIKKYTFASGFLVHKTSFQVISKQQVATIKQQAKCITSFLQFSHFYESKSNKMQQQLTQPKFCIIRVSKQSPNHLENTLKLNAKAYSNSMQRYMV